LEYAVIISVVVAALLAMNIYMKRASEGKLRESSDRLGEQFDIQKISSANPVHWESTHSGTSVQETGTALAGGAGATLNTTSADTSQTTTHEAIDK
jgi:hypothetical protein